MLLLCMMNEFNKLIQEFRNMISPSLVYLLRACDKGILLHATSFRTVTH